MKTHGRIRQGCEFEESFGELCRVTRLLVIVLIRESPRFADSVLVIVDLDRSPHKRTCVHEIGSEKAWLNDGGVNTEGLQFGIESLVMPSTANFVEP